MPGVGGEKKVRRDGWGRRWGGVEGTGISEDIEMTVDHGEDSEGGLGYQGGGEGSHSAISEFDEDNILRVEKGQFLGKD